MLKIDFSSSSSFKTGEPVTFKLTNSSDKPLSMAVSIAKSEIFPVYDDINIKSFIN